VGDVQQEIEQESMEKKQRQTQWSGTADETATSRVQLGGSTVINFKACCGNSVSFIFFTEKKNKTFFQFLCIEKIRYPHDLSHTSSLRITTLGTAFPEESKLRLLPIKTSKSSVEAKRPVGGTKSLAMRSAVRPKPKPGR
jgi:hypothetical protein